MKRIDYFIILMFVTMLLCIPAKSQQIINENFESYDTGSYIATEADLWDTWSVGPLGGLISEEQAHGGTKSMKSYIDNNIETDVILNVNDLTTGRFRVQFYLYVPAGHTGYYNILQDFNVSESKWGFQLSNTATGYKTETADSGETLAYMMLTFDGSSEQSFSFAKLEDADKMDFIYVQYDRFMGTLKSDASILGQIKDKRTLILNYKQNGSSKTAMFQLEGLEAIYNAITQ